MTAAVARDWSRAPTVQGPPEWSSVPLSILDFDWDAMPKQTIDQCRRADVRGPVKSGLSAWGKKFRSSASIEQDKRDVNRSEACRRNKRVAVMRIDVGAGVNQRMHQRDLGACAKSPVEYLVTHIVQRMTSVLVRVTPQNDGVGPCCILRKQRLKVSKVPLVDCIPYVHSATCFTNVRLTCY